MSITNDRLLSILIRIGVYSSILSLIAILAVGLFSLSAGFTQSNLGLIVILLATSVMFVAPYTMMNPKLDRSDPVHSVGEIFTSTYYAAVQILIAFMVLPVAGSLYSMINSQLPVFADLGVAIFICSYAFCLLALLTNAICNVFNVSI